MTLLGKRDGEDAGYLDMAELITARGASPREDLKELWRRIVFNMAVSNVDDHLRNHGFIMGRKGWRLSPVYDVNPSPEGGALSLAVDGTDRTISFARALDAAPYFELSAPEAEAYIERTARTVRELWLPAARRCGLSAEAAERMRPAFGECENI